MSPFEDTEVTLTSGRIRGVDRGPVVSWLGVPYAAPPVGPARFRPPAPAPPWSGVRDAVRPGPAAPQSGSFGGGGDRLGTGTAEDCLYLNVHAPAAPPADGRPRPVLVWIHGGAYTSGSGALYDGKALAELGDLVVVTVNYRLGVLGFVDLGSAVDAEVGTNLGLRDQIAALTWVRENVAAFGGDPDRVTVAGESAGSVSISLLTCAPAAAGLFRAAIMESGSYSLVHGDDTRREVARMYARELGLGRGDGDRLWSLPLAELVRAQRAVAKAARGTVAAAPFFDGDVVPASLAQAQAAVRPDLGLLAGHNHDEVTLFATLPGDVMPTERGTIERRLRASLGWDEAAALLARYPETRRGTRALGTDLNFARPTLHFAERHAAAGGRTFCYRFDAAVPVLGATHAAELPYLWGWSGLAATVLRGRATEARLGLGRRMQEHWVRFVRDLDPGPDWPAYALPARTTRIFDPAGDRTEHDPDGARRAAWAGRDVMTRA